MLLLTLGISQLHKIDVLWLLELKSELVKCVGLNDTPLAEAIDHIAL